MRLEAGQVAVVTGAASGIGRALVDALASRGLIIIAVDIEKAALDSTVAEVSAGGGKIEGHAVDVRTPEGLRAVADHVISMFGRVDLLCNNAGVVTSRLPVWEQSFDDLRWTTEVNLYGVANGIRAFVPQMVSAGRGHVVNTASIAGLAPIPGGGNAYYSASKHAIVGLSETLMIELAHLAPAVGVTILCPGPVPSGIHDAARNRPGDLDCRSRGTGPSSEPGFDLNLVSVPAATVAESVIDAIETRRPYLLTAPDVGVLARERVARLLKSMP